MTTAQKTAIECKAISVLKLTDKDVQQMYALFDKFYDCVSYETFKRDLMKKSEVILMRTNGIIKGFTTLKIMDVEIHEGGKTKTVPGIFSGDTIISPEYWGMKIINGVFANLLLREKLKRPFGELYWFLISKGYKTYLALTNNFTDYYPRRDQATPDHIQKVIDGYAMELYPEAYNKEAGLLQFTESMGQLKTTVAPIDAELIGSQPNIRFFQEKNPNWQSGDELVCLGIVNWSLFTNYIKRTLGFMLGAKTKSLKSQVEPS